MLSFIENSLISNDSYGIFFFKNFFLDKPFEVELIFFFRLKIIILNIKRRTNNQDEREREKEKK